MRVALGLEYRGTQYCGWQTQLNGCAIQDHLKRALEKFLGEPVSTTCAGRTDSGVHAMLQVVHLDTGIERDDLSWIRGTNAGLPNDIRVIWAKRVGDDFHARFSATARTYRYLLLNDAVECAAFHGLSGWFHAPLDIAKMRVAAEMLLGEHDFSAYRAAECQARSPVKTMFETSIETLTNPGAGDAAGGLMVFTLRGNAFLHHMVRNIVGELIYVGAGRRSLAEFGEVFAGRDRARAAPTFAPDGLYLSSVEYDARFGLPAMRKRHPFGL
ncbi:MAG: tRNA pseudouridine(38-40) synthase TruA [Burkholderiales bacterium]|nr:tRNA pseudouridine(38-40) synthase TruA [Burkholderiales bacterium]